QPCTHCLLVVIADPTVDVDRAHRHRSASPTDLVGQSVDFRAFVARDFDCDVGQTEALIAGELEVSQHPGDRCQVTRLAISRQFTVVPEFGFDLAIPDRHTEGTAFADNGCDRPGTDNVLTPAGGAAGDGDNGDAR